MKWKLKKLGPFDRKRKEAEWADYSCSNCDFIVRITELIDSTSLPPKCPKCGEIDEEQIDFRRKDQGYHRFK